MQYGVGCASVPTIVGNGQRVRRNVAGEWDEFSSKYVLQLISTVLSHDDGLWGHVPVFHIP
eukprot:1394988-Pyramimonas_sp.AAC.1